MERVLLHLGPVPIYKFGLTIALGILAGFWLVNREARRTGQDQDQVLNLVILVVLGGIIGARLFYILAYDPGYYWQHPMDMLKIYQGGLSIHGGIIGALAAGWWYSQHSKLEFWSLADLLVLGTILAQAIARIGCDIFGVSMAHAWPWGVMVAGNLVHPVQIYETILDLGLFLVLWGKRDRANYRGQLFIWYLFGYALIRFGVEFFRDNPHIIGPITPAHLTSLVFIVLAILLHFIRSKRGKNDIAALSHQKISLKVWLGTIFLAIGGIVIFYWLSSIPLI